MPTICGKCRRPNPPEAAFCFFDGALLLNQVRNGPVAAGRQPFANPFVFPSGRQCRSFDELVLACHEDWPEAISLLEQGYLESFLAGLGRTDLARAARTASRAVDKNRGFDELLEKLPSDVLQPPQLLVQPQEVNLGIVQVGENRRFTLHLENRGMRLLRGSVTCDHTSWLSLGDGAGSPEKLYQLASEYVLPVHVQGKLLRAGNKPLEGRLVFESNGGATIVTVRAEVPVKPFAQGVLAGAVTPRQIAEKAKAAPKRAAVFFEKGQVAQWYQENGWTYPVQGPAASGLGAIQQFYEALGLTPPPRVEIAIQQVHLAGSVGERLEYPLEIRTREKRPVYAYGYSDQPWLKVGRANLQGRHATLPLVVPGVPDRPGEKLQAQVLVTANGNQRFPIGISLTIDERRPKNHPPVATTSRARNDVQVALPYQPPPGPVPAVRAKPVEPEPPSTAAGRGMPTASSEKRSWKKHVILPGLLLIALLGIFLVDVLHKPWFGMGSSERLIDPEPRIAVFFHDRDEEVMLGKGGVKPISSEDDPDSKPAIWEASMRFGLVMLKGQDPQKPGQRKRLTFDEKGFTNNTCVRLDGKEFLFGERPFRLRESGRPLGLGFAGHWKSDEERDVYSPADGKSRGEGRRSVWVYDAERIQITQFVEVVPGEQSRLLDTCLVRYLIQNQDTRPHLVGLRFLLDTYIGANDGVPFTIPGARTLCDTQQVFDRPEAVPDFIQALERENLRDPGTVAQVQLRLGGRLEAPSRVSLGAWPNPELADRDPRCRQEKTLWEVPVFPIKTLKTPDSAVTLYWDEKELPPGGRRGVGFSYGLGNVASTEGAGRLGLSVGGRFQPGGEFTLTALVSEPLPEESLTLELPQSFQILDGGTTQPVPSVPAGAVRRTSPLSWRIKAGPEGTYTLQVKSSAGASQKLDLRIRSSSIFD